VLFVQRLRKRQGRAGGKAEATVGLALQAGQVVEQRRDLRRRLGLLGDRPRLAVAAGGDGARFGLVPQALGPPIRIVVRFI
jgi:hypothetical protein